MVRKAVLDDVAAIHAVIEAFSKRGIMLYRPMEEIYNSLRDFFVYEDNGAVVGVCALHLSLDGIGEIRSLAVRDKYTGRGIGTQLVDACIEEARSLGLKKVFALTYRTGFFHKLNFRTLNKEDLPHKIWSDCVRCIKFPNCDETAVIIDIK